MSARPSVKGGAPVTAQILLSKRANVFYLEHARVMVKDGRVIYLTAYKEDLDRAFNIPDQNTAFLLLGKGTSITEGAVRLLAESNVLIGFCGSGGSPLVAGVDIAFLSPQEEYRPTEFMQAWMQLWLDPNRRLTAARKFLSERAAFCQKHWGSNLSDLMTQAFLTDVARSESTEKLLSVEGGWAKSLYRILAQSHRLNEFHREEGARSESSPSELINSFLDHGNYIAYGYAAVSLYALGISFALPLLHGKTRRGALVFDVADLVKDAIVMPLAFSMGKEGAKHRDFRAELIDRMGRAMIVDHMIDILKDTLTEGRSEKP